jgi:hypothetical protein
VSDCSAAQLLSLKVESISAVFPSFTCKVLIRARDVASAPRPFFDRFEKQRVSVREYLVAVEDQLPRHLQRIVSSARGNAKRLLSIIGEGGLCGGSDHESLLDSLVICSF